ncbi:hypothetical protein BK644_12445 [Pseudomonas protegens]|nr:hypothetical protein BK644_12445 [Pseudomonas protegens]
MHAVPIFSDVGNTIPRGIEIFKRDRSIGFYFLKHAPHSSLSSHINVLTIGHVIVRSILMNIRPS